MKSRSHVGPVPPAFVRSSEGRWNRPYGYYGYGFEVQPGLIREHGSACHCFRVLGEAVRVASQLSASLFVPKRTNSGTPKLRRSLQQGHLGVRDIK